MKVVFIPIEVSDEAYADLQWKTKRAGESHLGFTCKPLPIARGARSNQFC